MSPVKEPSSSAETHAAAVIGGAATADALRGARGEAPDPARDRTVSGEARSAARRWWSARAGGLVVWVVYASIYAFVFVLSGFPAWMAIRAAVANALPDGLLALVAIAATRRARDAGSARIASTAAPAPDRHVSDPRLFVHVAIGPVCAALASGLKCLLLMADVWWVRAPGGTPYHFEWALAAWQFFLSLLTYAAVAGASQAQASARRFRLASEAAERAEMLRARAELAALRAQLNPHFLFNVLHSVIGLVRRDPALAEQALERLGDLMRYALHVHREGVDWASLRQEWEFMESYLDLEKIRLGERLRTSLQAEPAALDRLVPSFLLQPLVENAVRHGIAPRAAGGTVRVGARTVGSDLTLEVENDAPAAAAGAVQDPPGPRSEGIVHSIDGRPAVGGQSGRPRDRRDVQPPHAPPTVEARANGERGMGLRLLAERLAALYGRRATLASGPTPDGGYRVVITLPGAGGPSEEADA